VVVSLLLGCCSGEGSDIERERQSVCNEGLSVSLTSREDVAEMGIGATMMVVVEEHVVVEVGHVVVVVGGGGGAGGGGEVTVITVAVGIVVDTGIAVAVVDVVVVVVVVIVGIVGEVDSDACIGGEVAGATIAVAVVVVVVVVGASIGIGGGGSNPNKLSADIDGDEEEVGEADGMGDAEERGDSMRSADFVNVVASSGIRFNAPQLIWWLIPARNSSFNRSMLRLSDAILRSSIQHVRIS
jgi:hypothetical protein